MLSIISASYLGINLKPQKIGTGKARGMIFFQKNKKIHLRKLKTHVYLHSHSEGWVSG